jgi:hypothetical protein
MSDKKRGRGRPRSERPLSKKTVRIYTDQCDLSNKEIRAAIDAGLMILSTSETADVFDNAPANEQGQIEYPKLGDIIVAKDPCIVNGKPALIVGQKYIVFGFNYPYIRIISQLSTNHLFDYEWCNFFDIKKQNP